MKPSPRTREQLETAGVTTLFGAYVDIHGVPKSKAVPIGHYEDYLAGSELYTVGALEGMGELGPNEDECVGLPDLDSLTVLPWDTRYAVAAADLEFHGKPYSHDSRAVLKRQIAAAAAQGYVMNMGVEPEVYVLREVDGDWVPFVSDDTVNLPTRGYDLEATIQADEFLVPMVDYINQLGWDVYSFDHEGGDGQYEFDFNYTDSLAMADRMIIFRLMAKQVARSLGCIATFMPKPRSDSFGSGAHLNVSLADIDSGTNLFEALEIADSREQHGYTELAYQFTAGVLAHSGAITAIACPTTNSYKRMEPYGRMREMSWAPVYRAYGHNNRTLIARLPMNRRCLEVRQVDSACNFYLATAMVLAAGLEGIERKMDPGDAVEYSTYDFTDVELKKKGVERVPRTLGQALEELEADGLAKAVLGDAFHATFLKYKRKEWLDYCLDVTPWEQDKYLRLW